MTCKVTNLYISYHSYSDLQETNSLNTSQLSLNGLDGQVIFFNSADIQGKSLFL